MKTRYEIIEEDRQQLIAWAREAGKGDLVGTAVLGDTIVYTFACGMRAFSKLPSGSVTAV